MNDKIFLIQSNTGNKYATAQLTQFDAESVYQFSYGEDIDYTIKEVELDSIINKKDIEWF